MPYSNEHLLTLHLSTVVENHQKYRIFSKTLKNKGRSTLEQKVPKITVRWRLKYQNSHECKQIAEICKHTAVKK